MRSKDIAGVLSTLWRGSEYETLTYVDYRGINSGPLGVMHRFLLRCILVVQNSSAENVTNGSPRFVHPTLREEVRSGLGFRIWGLGG